MDTPFVLSTKLLPSVFSGSELPQRTGLDENSSLTVFFFLNVPCSSVPLLYSLELKQNTEVLYTDALRPPVVKYKMWSYQKVLVPVESTFTPVVERPIALRRCPSVTRAFNLLHLTRPFYTGKTLYKHVVIINYKYPSNWREFLYVRIFYSLFQQWNKRCSHLKTMNVFLDLTMRIG